MKTGYPYLIYLLIILSIGGVAFLYVTGTGFGKSAFYIVIIFFFFYVFLLRYACKMELKGEHLQIHYIFPWDKNITVDLSKVERIKTAKGFFGLTAQESLGGAFPFPNYCYDQITFEFAGTTPPNTINVNTRMGDLDPLIRHISKYICGNRKLP